MKKQVYEIDKNGYIEEIYVAEVDVNGNILDEDKKHFISLDPLHGLYKAKWTGVDWIEGLSQSEIDQINNQPRQFSDNEILGQTLSEREIQEIIQGQQISDLEIRMLMGGL